MKEKPFVLCDESWSGRAAGNLGKGLVAGVLGTIAITISQQIEMEKSGRQPSNTPILAAQKVFQINPQNEIAEKKLNNMVHYAYGTSLGLIRGILSILGIKGIIATLMHISIVQALSMIILPKLKIAPPASEWDRKTILNELMHHSVYGIAAGLSFDWMNRCIRKTKLAIHK